MTSITDEGTQQSGSGAEQVKERVQDAAEKAKSRTGEQVRTQIDERSTTVGRQITSAASAMREASDRLRGEGNERAASLVDAVTERGHRLGGYLESGNADRLLRDVEDVARRQPLLFVAGSAVVGFIGARFMKASSTSRYQAAAWPSQTYPTPTGVARPPASPPGAYVGGGSIATGTPTGTGGGTSGLG